ncbi:MAG TPA: purine-nucleoside phosphorylase [Candidatus Omnitrophota bacterium]|nr:purine-nucleoside phosphorylase [Candidatus Omnitrophota bacterium]
MTMKRFQKKQNPLMEPIDKCLAYLRKKNSFQPDIALILGTGLGNLAKRIKAEKVFAYEELPFFPKTTVQSHGGNLILGELGGKKIAAMEGRFHFYEGYSLAEVTFPVRVLRQMGAKTLVVSNAAGGLNLSYKKGEIVLLTDHINFMGVNPLVGPNADKLGPRFPDMCEPYSNRLIDLTVKAAREQKIFVKQGVYIGVTGPCLETRAEYRMMKNLGADLVGMSTVPEVIVGVHMGMEILGVSIVTDTCDPDHLEPVNIQEIIKTANEAGPKLDKLIGAAIAKF